MPLFYNIVVINGGYYNPPQTLFVGSNPYGGNFIQGNGYGAIIYGETQYSLYSGTVGDNIIWGSGGSNTIYGDADALYGTVTAHRNTIWADTPSANDSSAVNTIYGNAFAMGGDSTSGSTDAFGDVIGNTIHDSTGTASYLYGNAYAMTDHAWGGHNVIYAVSVTSYAYGDACHIDGSASYDSTHGYGVQAGGNTIYLLSPNGYACGDAWSIEGLFHGGHNALRVYADAVDQQNATVFGTAYALDGTIECGSNEISGLGRSNSTYTFFGDAYQNCAGSDTIGGNNTIDFPGYGNATIYGECQSNAGLFYGGHNAFYAPAGINTIYGDCASNTGTFSGGHNTIYGGEGPATIWGLSTDTIYGDCASNTGTFSGGYNTIHAGTGSATIYGDCVSNTGTFSGGHNTIYAETANATLYGSATDGQNTFVFAPGSAVDQIGSRNGDGSVFQGFDQEVGAALNHAQGDVIDVSAYHFAGLQNLVIGANPSGDTVIYLPPAGASNASQITLVGVHPQDLTASDFHF
jgi:hypothetical protein